MKALVTVDHGWYGCDTGCCGHTVHVKAPADAPDGMLPKDSRGQPVRSASQFYFEHPWEADEQEFVAELVKMTVDHGGFASALIKAFDGYEIESAQVCDD